MALTKQTKLVRAASLCIIGVALIICAYSILNPFSKVGIRTLFVDSKTNTYQEGRDFTYAGYSFHIVSNEVKLVPDKADCSGLITGGIFSPEAKSVMNTNQNWWPKEDCEKSNLENVAKAEQQRYLFVGYIITNKTGEVMTLPENWLTVIGEDGKGLYTEKSRPTVTPSNTVRKENRETISSNKAQSIIISIPGHANQVVSLSDSVQ